MILKVRRYPVSEAEQNVIDQLLTDHIDKERQSSVNSDQIESETEIHPDPDNIQDIRHLVDVKIVGALDLDDNHNVQPVPEHPSTKDIRKLVDSKIVLQFEEIYGINPNKIDDHNEVEKNQNNFNDLVEFKDLVNLKTINVDHLNIKL